MLSFRGGGGGRGVGGGGWARALLSSLSLFLHYWSLNCCDVALALICQAMVRLL